MSVVYRNGNFLESCHFWFSVGLVVVCHFHCDGLYTDIMRERRCYGRLDHVGYAFIQGNRKGLPLRLRFIEFICDPICWVIYDVC